MADLELRRSRKEIERLKGIKLQLEDDVTNYRAEVSRWKTLYEQGSPHGRTTSGLAVNNDHLHQQVQTPYNYVYNISSSKVLVSNSIYSLHTIVVAAL